jgi:predicted nucleic acid-binding Zn ribbon protein
MASPKYIEYDGLKFCRDEKTGYYLNSTIRKRLHRYVWEKEVGTIPKGCHIHHINGDKSDNRIMNLSLMTAAGHEHLHGQEQARKETLRQNIERARPYAIQWHKSDAGKEWHSKHATGRKPPRAEKVCEICGKSFMGTKAQKFCSNVCKAKFRRDSGVDNVPRICKVCGNVFMSSRFTDQKTCSRECSSIYHRGWNKRL